MKEVEKRKPNAVKRFFDSLFSPREKPSAGPVKVETGEEASIVTVPSTLNTITRGDGGQWQVRTKSPSYLEPLVHKFGDLIVDKTTAERLFNADPMQEYQLGDCGGLAGELWHRNKNVAEYYIMQTDSEPEWGLHHFVKLHDGTYVDSLGLWSEKALLSYWRDVDSTARITTFDVEPEPAKDPNHTISNPELFNILTRLISKHVTGETL
ncbi:MAG: hypothetical protein H9W81_15785 [Enterococcus sp.]|nr:hypothetical protein [Enterococcus sp.]